MIKLRSKRFCRSNSKIRGNGGVVENGCRNGGEIKWEVRPGGMLVQKREDGGSSNGEGMIRVRVSTGTSQWHDISIEATSTFGDLKVILSLVTGLEPREQRILFRGKERENGDYLHMVGVGDMDKVLLLEDPAIKERKLHACARDQALGAPCRTISVSNSKIRGNGGVVENGCRNGGEIKWEVRPGGMLVQKREDGGSSNGEGMIRVRVSTGTSQWHDISIEATSTFGDLKVILSLVTGLEPREQRILFRGKERENGDYLHMVGVGDMDKVLLLEDPAIKERKLHACARDQALGAPCRTISV